MKSRLKKIVLESFEDGARLPGENAWAAELAVSLGTIRRALGELTSEGLLERRVPAGTFVRKNSYRPVVGLVLPRYESFSLTRWKECFFHQCQSGRFDPRLVEVTPTDSPSDLGAMIERQKWEKALVVSGDPAWMAQLIDSLVARRLPVTTFQTTVPLARSFRGDEALAADHALDHLSELGHRHLAFAINEPAISGDIPDRLAALTERAKERGLRLEVFDAGIHPWQSSYESVPALMPALLASRATALIFASDSGAWAACKWLRRNGVRVPQDLSVIGYNDDAPNPYMDPALTSVGFPADEMIRAFLTEEESNLAPRLFPPGLVIRESTGPSPS